MRNRFPYYRAAFGLLLLIALLWYFDIVKVVQQFATLDPPWVMLTAALIVVSTLISAVNLHLFMNQEGNLPFAKFLPLYWTSWAIGIVFPGQVGDVASIAAMLKRRGMAWQVSLGRSLLDKLISFTLMLVIALASLPALVSVEWNFPTLAIALAMSTALLTICYIGRNQLVRYFDPANDGWRGFVARTWEQTVATIKGSPGKVALNFLLTATRIAITGLAYCSMFAALQYTNLDILKVIPMVAMTSVVAYLPISFNGIGTVEITGVLLFARLGMAPTSILSAYLALRLLVICLAWLPAAIWLLTSNQHRD